MLSIPSYLRFCIPNSRNLRQHKGKFYLIVSSISEYVLIQIIYFCFSCYTSLLYLPNAVPSNKLRIVASYARRKSFNHVPDKFLVFGF